jgi:hypothetical protein
MSNMYKTLNGVVEVKKNARKKAQKKTPPHTIRQCLEI